MDDISGVVPDEQAFDLDKLVTTKSIVDIFQDGTFLVCTTDTGQVFRHSIRPDKILNKNREGGWILQNMNLRA